MYCCCCQGTMPVCVCVSRGHSCSVCSLCLCVFYAEVSSWSVCLAVLCLCVGRRACMCEFVHLWLWLCWVSAGRLCFPPVPVCGGDAEWRLFLWSVPELSRGGGRMEVWDGKEGGGTSTPVSTSTDLGHTSLSACFLFLCLSLCHSFSLRLFCLSLTPLLACVCSLFELPVSRCVSYNTDLPLLLVVRLLLPSLLTNQIPPSKAGTGVLLLVAAVKQCHNSRCIAWSSVHETLKVPQQQSTTLTQASWYHVNQRGTCL